MSRHISSTIPTGAAVVCALVLLAASPKATPIKKEIEISVREGTSMAFALSPDKKRVVIDLQGGLWVVPIEGGAAKRITDEYGDARQPSWSPDGRTIAFQSYRDGTWRIWTVAPDGSGLKAVTSGPFDDREPHWSPDGARVAFSSDRSGNYDIWVLERATGAVRQITSHAGNDFFPSWSPDGREIAFVSTRADAPGVYIVAVDGAAERLIAGSKGSVGTPSWSPDGKVLFTVGPFVGPTSIEHERQLIYDGRVIATGEDYFPFRAAWLSNDEFLYPADGRIKRRSLSGGERKPIEFSATLTLKPPVYTRKRYDFDATTERRALGIMRPVVSPDGTRLAFAALGDIWTTGIAGKDAKDAKGAKDASTPVRVTDDAFVDTDPAWSPDGTRLAFASDRAGGMDVWVRDLRTGQDRRLTSLPDAEMAPIWSPDGRWIAFVSNQAYEQGELYIVAADGGEPRKIHERIFGVGYPSWSADGTFVMTSAVKPYSTRFRESMNYYWIVPVAEGGADARPEMIVPEEHAPIGKRAGDGPAISPDGRTIAFVSNGYLFIRPIDARGKPTGPARQITQELSDAISWAGPTDILYMSADRVKIVSIASANKSAARDVPINLTWRPAIATGRKVVHASRLIDGVQPTARTDIDIVIDGQRIAAIEPHRDALHSSAGTTVVDASGQSVMPGLIEGHGHTLKEHGDSFGRVHLAYGITGFRDVGGVPYDVLESKEAITSGRRVGPTVFTTGYLLDGRRPYYPMATTAPDAAVVDRELERARRLDYDMLKTYVRLPDLLQKRVIEGAHRLGIPTSSHEIYPAALSGSDSVEHVGATSRRGYASKQSLMGRAYDDAIQIIAKSGMTMTPTLALGGFQTAIAETPAILDDPRWRLQPPWTDAVVRARSATRRVKGLTEGQRTVLALHRAGARIIAGVDSPLTPYGTALHIELREYVTAGLTPFEALKTATINPATLMGVAKDLGTVEVGKLADLVVVDGNPLVEIADANRVRQVIKHGEVYTLEQLLRPAR